MVVAKITSKGQVTVPKQVREALGVGTGDRIEFVLLDDHEVRVRPAARGDLSRLKGVLAGRVPFVSREAERRAATRQAIVETLDLPGDQELDALDG